MVEDHSLCRDISLCFSRMALNCYSETNVFCMCDLFVDTVCRCDANVRSVTTTIESTDAVDDDKVSQGPAASSEDTETFHFVRHQTTDPSSNAQVKSVTKESVKGVESDKVVEGRKVTETLQVDVSDRGTVQTASDEPLLECAQRSSAAEASQAHNSQASAERIPCEDDIGKFTRSPASCCMK